MEGEIVNVGMRMDALIEFFVDITANHALATQGNEVVGVEGLDEMGRLRGPTIEPLNGGLVVAEGARFIAELPGEDGGLVFVEAVGDGVAASEDGLDELEVELLGLAVCGKLGGILYIVIPPLAFGRGRIAEAHLAEVETKTAAPIPTVRQIEHGCHLARLEFIEQTVQATQERIVELAWLRLKDGLYPAHLLATAVGAHEYAQIFHANRFQLIKFGAQSGKVAALSLGSQDWRVPQIRTYIIIGTAVALELAIANGNQIASRDRERCAHKEQEKERTKTMGKHREGCFSSANEIW